MGHAKLTDSSHEAAYPDYLVQLSAKSKKRKSAVQNEPLLIDMSQPGSEKQLEDLVRMTPSVEMVDNYAEQYAELLLSQNAHLYRANSDVQIASVGKLLKEHYHARAPWKHGSWAYFPWSNQLVHILAKVDFEDLRTIRNRDLITREEQAIVYNFSAACFGMSVGSAGALALSISGMSRDIKLVDGAVISGSNLNRILTGVASVGLGKAHTIGQKIYEMNPYSHVYYHDKVTATNIESILTKDVPTNIVIDEIDDIEMKVRIRSEARKLKIPVLMATEIGDTIILDVERFDLEPDRNLFHGQVPGIERLLQESITDYREWTKHAVKIIDPSNMSIKMQKSLLKIGTNIVTHPQLGSTVMMTGGVLAFAVKNIALGNPIKSGRYVISLERQLLSDHQTREYRRAHKKHTKSINSAVNSM